MAFKFDNSLSNYEDIVQNLKDYYQSKGYNFVNGGNFDLLMRTLAWHKMSTGQDISNLCNNLYLSSVNNKNSAYELAKSNGYIVRRNIPSRVKTKLVYNGSDQSSNFVVKTVVITGNNNGFDYYANNISFVKSSISNKYEAVFSCQEKQQTTFQYIADGSINQKVVLPQTNITDDDIIISSKIGNVTYSWNLAESFGSIPESTSNIFFLSTDTSERTTITFGNGIVGRVPQSNETFTIQYNITNSTGANNESEFSLKNIVVYNSNKNLNNLSNYTLTTGISFGATGNETISEIATNASKRFSSLNNNIVRRDFENILQIQSDYVAYSNIASTEDLNSILSKYFLLLVPSNYINNTVVNSSQNETLPFTAIENLVVSTIENDKFSKYFSDWIYIDIASPTYFYYDIIPSIKIAKYKNFDSISNNVRNILINYSNSNLHGFNKSYYETNLISAIKSIGDDVVDVKIANNYYVVFNRANIEDKDFIKIPSNFIKRDATHYNDLVNYNNYIYPYLKDVDKTIKSDALKTSDDNFLRYFVSTNEQITTSDQKIFDLTFDTTAPYSMIESASQIYSIVVNNIIMNVKVFPVQSGITQYSLYNTLQDNSLIQQNVPTYTVGDNTKYLVYCSYNSTNYLLGEIKEISNSNGLKILDKITNLFYIDILFKSLNVSVNVNDNFLSFAISKVTNELGIGCWVLTGNIIFNILSDTTNITNLKLVSRKEVANFNFINNTFTSTDNQILSSVVDENITLTTIDNSILCKVNKNIDNLVLDSTSINLYPATEQYVNYKNNKFVVEQDNNVYRIYVYENIDESVVASIDNIDGNIYFKDNIAYKENESVEVYKNLNITSLFDKILDETKIYRLNLISKNNVPTINNITDSFVSNDSIFTLPNISLVSEIIETDINNGVVNG